jgi:hypothetical protein
MCVCKYKIMCLILLVQTIPLSEYISVYICMCVCVCVCANIKMHALDFVGADDSFESV